MELLTYDEIARRWNRSRQTVVNRWARDPRWPAAEGKRGRALVFDAAAVDAALVSILGPPVSTLDGDPDELLTLEEVAAASGEEWSTLRAYRAQRRLPPPVGKRRIEVGGKQKGTRMVWLYRRGDMAEVLGSMRRRHKR